jgi:hypothetical protein
VNCGEWLLFNNTRNWTAKVMLRTVALAESDWNAPIDTQMLQKLS